ncbi:MAG: hypothetical protein L0H25_02770 [Micrococcales bacterium]|nr:hypothetical protein [Micrococcales bacterium]
MCNDSDPAPSAALHDLHDALLPGTIHNALRTDFFRARWAGHDVDNVDRSLLATLPMIDKEEIRAAGSAAQVRVGTVCNDVLTSGTTGNPLVTVRSEREQEFITDFFTRQLRRRPVERYMRGLQFTNPYHGHLISVPSSTHFHRVSVYDAGSFEYGRRTLLESHDDQDVDPRCSVLSGLERCLRAFTADTIARFPNGFDATALRLVVSTSQYLTANWRARLESTWHAAVVDRFSVSEIFGGAGQCLQCGWYHFDPHVVPEVVGATSGDLLSEGRGLLALTALYPFQQAQPLVRYLTGDLVDVTHEASCRPGTTAIKPLGRARYGVPEPGGDGWLVTPASVLEAVDESTEVLRIPRFVDVEQVVDPYAIGHPKYRTLWQSRASAVDVEIQVALRGDVPARRIVEISSDLTKDVIDSNPNLRKAVRAGTASMSVKACEDVATNLIAQAHSGGVWSPA